LFFETGSPCVVQAGPGLVILLLLGILDYPILQKENLKDCIHLQNSKNKEDNKIKYSDKYLEDKVNERVGRNSAR
jgi:hypothetical protein